LPRKAVSKKAITVGHRWFTPVILATWEAEIRRITVRGHPGQIVQETPISKVTRAKWTGGVAQAVELRLCKLQALSSKKLKGHYQKQTFDLGPPEQ
jgi:hypothetical protein